LFACNDVHGWRGPVACFEQKGGKNDQIITFCLRFSTGLPHRSKLSLTPKVALFTLLMFKP
jgi:hypothetical protein